MIKHVLKSVIVLGLVGSLMGGATLATWTASASVSGNVASTTTLTVEAKRDNGDNYPGPMFYTQNSEGGPGDVTGYNSTGLWYPGKTAERQFFLLNTNSQRIPIQITGIKATLSGLNSGTPAYNEFIQKMMFKVKFGNLDVTEQLPLSSFLLGVPIAPNPALIILQGGESLYQIDATLGSTANDSVQGISPVIDFSITVTQA